MLRGYLTAAFSQHKHAQRPLRIKWVFDTPDHPFEQYLATIIPDVYEKYRTAPRTLADYM